MRPAALAMAFAALAIAACSPGRDERTVGGRLERVALERIETGEPPAVARPLASFQPGLEPEQWVSNARTRGVAHMAGSSSPGPPALVIDHRGAKRLERAVQFDPRKVDEIVFTLSCAGSQRVEAALFSKERVIGRSTPVDVPARPEPTRVALRLPRTKEAACDRLVLSFNGAARRIGIAGLEVLERPPLAWVAETPLEDLVGIGEEARRGSWLSTQNGLRGRVENRRGTVLSFAFGQPQRKSRQGTLRLRASDGAGGEILRRLPLDGQQDRPRWNAVVVPLESLRDGEIEVKLTVEPSGGPEATCVVSEMGVWRTDAPSAPSVLLVTSDTHRGDHLGVAPRGADVRTPTLDALAERGVLFTDCFSPTNSTNPSHIALLTGIHPRDTGVLNNKTPLAQGATTLAQRFREAGYRTWAVISIPHLGPVISGLGAGFDRANVPRGYDRQAEASVDILAGWLDEAGPAPVFAWLHVFDAHTPYAPPGKFDRLYYPAGADPYDASLPEPDAPEAAISRSYPGRSDIEYRRAQYKAEITYLDAQLARILERPLFRDGITAFLADHGESLGNHGIWFNHAGLYPDTIHIPLILAWPGAPAGRRVDAAATHLDVGRTLLNLAGLGAAAFPGRDLSSALEPGDAEDAPRYALASNATEASITAGGFHLIVHLRSHGEDVREAAHLFHEVELYDLRADPGCTRSLVEDEPERAKRMRALLIEWLEGARPLGLAGETSRDPEVIAGLARLGYADGNTEGAGKPSLWREDDCERCLPFR